MKYLIKQFLDKNRHLVAIAYLKSDSIRIGDFTIDEKSPTFIIAEIGNNHNGSLKLAKNLIDKVIAFVAKKVYAEESGDRIFELNKGQCRE
ncbi:hypothetical protein [Geminocystis sp. GBBB08]|uniref:hypothetical protein n=1 Tax=Geminocystis sp. GBBB08 TaxID=2604140 RepID=UPI0027E2F192|nr:hypothetical protein [Geminocystis sp. GBBB08]MBL1210147.1 hypothetical protein [Geminocystis sp. GBBB08]